MDQVASKHATLERLLADAVGDVAAGIEWLTPMRGAASGFRTKAKMVIGGTVQTPTLGILDEDGHGVDLRDCPLYDQAVTQACAPLAAFVTLAGLTPYSVPDRRGELKHIIVTASPAGHLMVRFVMRSTEALARMRKHLGWLQARLPSLVVVTMNVLPEHRAVLEGDREIVLTERDELPMPLGEVELLLRPRSFFQTNTEVARALYAQVAAWVDESQPQSVWDLYCGAGGFALHLLAPGRAVTGVESSEQAVLSARAAADQMATRGVPGAAEARFEIADATPWASSRAAPDVVIVNPPRRGIGADLARWLESSGVHRVVYSSCNAVTLAQDIAAMRSLAPVKGRLLDMFPHTEHFEVVVLLERA